MLPIHKDCPKCRSTNSVSLDKHTLRCKTCDFSVTFLCPFCDADLETSPYTEDQFGGKLTCNNCNREIALQKIQYMINNTLVVDYEKHCSYCNLPMLHRPEMNLGHRCFNFPKCNGQTSLFETTKESLVFLDFETTGLDMSRDHIIEFGAVKIDAEGYDHTFQSFVKPPDSISPKITQITGITNEMVENSPVLEPVLRDFMEFLGNSIIIAHNAEFDLLWLLSSLMKLNMPLPSQSVICTLKWAKALGEPRASLGVLTKKYKIGHANAHRALADAAATRELFFIYDNNPKVPRPLESIGHYEEAAKKIALTYFQ